MTDNNTARDDTVNEKGTTTIVGHLLIRDVDTNEIIVNQRDGQPDLGNDGSK